MSEKIKDIPIELDMKILDYASKKQFNHTANVYKFIQRIAAVFIFAAIVGGAVFAFGRQPKQAETLLADVEFEQFYYELTMLSESFETKCDSLDEKLNEELSESFLIAYLENPY
jgi:hypothetical protein